jgi:hypothetical protein
MTHPTIVRPISLTLPLHVVHGTRTQHAHVIIRHCFLRCPQQVPRVRQPAQSHIHESF